MKKVDFITPGIPDAEFIRDKIPMTKEEVRVISLCKLRLFPGAVLFDIGSGTGSIAVEAARLGAGIKVFAIEQNPNAAALIAKNKEHFQIPDDALVIKEATAPDCFLELPSPTHAFIGGSKGRLGSILCELYKKNPNMRVVINAVSLESVSEANALIKKMPVKNAEVIQIGVSRAEAAGDYNLLKAQNPVFIFSFDFDSAQDRGAVNSNPNDKGSEK